jgi:diguanylate cyclase (GGDEF)-like protein/PAS domain S-box-containing protein
VETVSHNFEGIFVGINLATKYDWKPRIPVLIAILLLVISNGVLASTSTVQLSEDEKRWLSEHPSIRLAVDIDWSPFEYIDDENQYVGMAAEYIALVGQKLGIEFDVEKEKPWSEVVESVKSGELDMYSCVVSTVQRREYVNFTEPYLSDHPELELYLADNVADALEKLSVGKVYAYIGNIATVSHVIKRDGITNIKISGQTPYNYELSMGVRKDWSEFMPILQKALDSITEQEHDQIYQNWIKLRYEYGFDYDLLWKVLAGVFLVIMIILIWNRRLSNEIRKRVETEKSLNEAHKQLEQTNKQLVNYVDIVDKYVITSTTDSKGIITYTSDAFCEISGYSRQELIGNNHSIVRHKDMPASIYKELWSSITRGQTWQGEIKNRKKDGSYYWVHAYISPVCDEQGNITGYTAIREDITSKKLAEELSITDELTSLFNRRHFNNLFPQELARAEREKKTIVLMIIDVDYFKPYNDNYGHQQGDSALRAVSGIIKDTLRRAGDFAFRIGGEEFGVIVTVDDRDVAFAIAEKLRKAVEDLGIEHAYSEVAAYLTISIGMEIHQCGDLRPADMDLIYRLADDALYQAKENGRNQVASSCMDGWQATINQ